MTAPKVSVIIPMYNAEKFIRQTLISVLASKFTDYEVIVVDDCSTDSSVAQAEKLLPHFDGRLKILSTQTNSGGAGIPRNVGINHASGKYVTFIDNDDMILPTALGDFFELAEKFQADVVYAEKYLSFDGEGDFKWNNLTVMFGNAPDEAVDVPTFEPDDLRERIRRDMSEKFFILPWGKFYRRDFLTENKIDFPQMRFAEDLTFCFKCLCLAKKYLRVPNVTNIRRELKRSTAKMIVDSCDGVKIWLDIVTKNISILDEFTGTLEVFQTDAAFRREVMKFYIDKHFAMITDLFQCVEPHEVEKIFFDELQNPALNSTGKQIVTAYLYAERALMR